MGVRVVVVEPGMEPYVDEIYPDENGSYLRALQNKVDGYIEVLDVLFGDEPALIVNEEGAINGMAPNRAVYANARMEGVGYLSQIDYASPVGEGDLYTVIFGPFVAVGFDEEGQPRDLTDREMREVMGAFSGEISIESGVREVAGILARGRRGI